jgi:hypothetical protein
MSGCFFSANKGLKSPFFIGKKGENMTEINLMTSGQRLIVTQRVVIASGDIESVQAKVIFDSAWDNYPVRTATFYTSKDSTVYERLMVDNECTVPPEVLAESATLFIGIRGASTDGAKIKTSSLVKYKIEPGAVSGNTTLTPSMDLYQQFLASLDDKVDPIRADVYAKMEAKMEAKIAEIEEQMQEHEKAITGSISGELLWRNASFYTDSEGRLKGFSSLAPIEIKMDLSQYTRFVVVTAYVDSNGLAYHSNSQEILEKGITYNCSSNGSYDAPCIIKNDGIYFSQCNYHVPRKVYGYKTGGIKNDDIVLDDDFEL